MKYAIITAASSGIGWELARIFAADRINLVLVARNEVWLQQLSKDLETTFGIRVYTLAKDLSRYESSVDIWEFCTTNQLDIKYLVNNAGFGYFGMFAGSS